MKRFVFKLHRYLGIAVGFVVLLWALSGVVMVFQPYPELSQQQKNAMLPSLSFNTCCKLQYLTFLSRDFSLARLEMMGEAPVVRLQTSDGAYLSYSLKAGTYINAISKEKAQHLAAAILNPNSQSSYPRYVDTVHDDQWTMDSKYHRYRPLHKFAADDGASSELYVSAYSGEVVQLTTAEQRFLAYIGPVVHWLYPKALKDNDALWRPLVLSLASIGIFLSVTGVYIGYSQFKRRHSGRYSSYHGLNLVHHYVGLLGGIVLLMWLGSGILSMNPAGILISQSAASEQARIAKTQLPMEQLASILADQQFQKNAQHYVQISFSMFNGQLIIRGMQPNGRYQSLNLVSYQPEAASPHFLNTVAKTIQPNLKVETQGIIAEEDRYYYATHANKIFPVYRIVYAQPSDYRYYLDPQSGEILHKVDAQAHWYRWLFYAIHRMDFSRSLRQSAAREVLLIFMLLMVITLSASGTYMGSKRIFGGWRRGK